MVMWRATLANATGIRVYPTLIQTNMAEVSSPVIGSFAGSVLMYKESPNRKCFNQGIHANVSSMKRQRGD